MPTDLRSSEPLIATSQASRVLQSAWCRRLLGELSHHSLLIIIALGYVTVALLVLSAHDANGLPVLRQYLISATCVPLIVAFLRVVREGVHHVCHVRPFSLGGLWRGILGIEMLSPRALAAAIVPLALLPAFFGVFTSFKTVIPEIAPYAWDSALSRADMWLHFGRLPSDWLQPILGHPSVTATISHIYHLWHFLWLVVYWQVLNLDDRTVRMQFLLAFVLCWSVLGSGAALLFSSVGPCFYGGVVDGPNPYEGLMTYLHQADAEAANWSLEAQAYLWEIYQSGSVGVGSGISAMPSLHVSIATLIVLLVRCYSRRMSWVAGAFPIAIMVGTVHLGWHYAIDGYVAIAMTYLIWKLSGLLARRVVPEAPTADRV